MSITIGNAGYVELLETFGTDLTVVNAARVSFNKESNEFSDKDKSLVKYLAKNNHISPFFHPQLRFRIKMPIFVAREWFRHTIGFARNEVSRRYVDSVPEIWIPEEFRERDTNLKQGSKSCSIADNENIKKIYEKAVEESLKTYDLLLKSNVAPEIARSILPQGMYTEFIETASLSAYSRLCNLRLDPHAQKEIQEFAKAVYDLMKEKFPFCVHALFPEN
jgi:thymidylate synthase (FAD)